MDLNGQTKTEHDSKSVPYVLGPFCSACIVDFKSLKCLEGWKSLRSVERYANAIIWRRKLG